MNRVVGTSVFSTFTLKGLFSFFIFFSFCVQKGQKNTKRLQANKNKKTVKKHLRGKLLISLFAFCAFAWLRLCAFGTFCTFGACKIFLLKKEFKTALMTSFILLLLPDDLPKDLRLRILEN